jgi:peptide/nickel transport system substrate-binding protein
MQSSRFSWSRPAAVGSTVLICLSLILSSCATFTSPAGLSTVTPVPSPTPTRYAAATPAPTLRAPAVMSEAPELTVLVNSGKLPIIYQRLPQSPKVVPVTEQVGTYGGVWRMLIQPVADERQFLRTVAYEPLVRWRSDWSGIESNLAAEFTVNQRATEYSFVLRRGLRWSDGAPFTTDDIRFWYEDVLLNPKLTPIVPDWLKSRGQAARFEFIDDVSFKVYFPYPNSLFLEQLATPEALMITSFPAHYIQRFHEKYAASSEIEGLVRDGGYSSWEDMFLNRVGINSTDAGSFVDPARPRMTAWVLNTPYQPKVEAVTWIRNPFYWKVDMKGNQLPYIDRVEFHVVNNLDEAVNNVYAGEIDMQNLHSMGMDLDALAGNEEIGSYVRYGLVDGSNNVMVISLNMTHTDPVKRQIFRNKSFRIGLSHAINRQEILDFLYHGEGQPWQAAPRADSPFYDLAMGEMYTEYSVEKANDWLDKAGFKRDANGNRIGPDGFPITFTIEVLENQPQQVAMLNMVAKYWSVVGIDLQLKVDSFAMYTATVQTNQHDAAAWTGGATLLSDVLLDPSNYVPVSTDTLWAVTWANWFNRVPGYENQLPEPAPRKTFEMYERIRTVRNTAEQIDLMKGVLIYARESYNTIGIALGPERHGLRQKNFMNVPEKMPAAWLYPDPAPTNPEQYFFSTEP